MRHEHSMTLVAVIVLLGLAALHQEDPRPQDLGVPQERLTIVHEAVPLTFPLTPVTLTHLAGYPATFKLRSGIAETLARTAETLQKGGYELRVVMAWSITDEHKEGAAFDAVIFQNGRQVLPDIRHNATNFAGILALFETAVILEIFQAEAPLGYTVRRSSCSKSGEKERWFHIEYVLKTREESKRVKAETTERDHVPDPPGCQYYREEEDEWRSDEDEGSLD